eukprot:Lithocolla_globosa_v1_NODE_3472_length_1659_cov_88.924611.p2 type:complete len:100 gc:universal NODE_3472_length_1659_cov_88.924611:62-361(+)
MEEEVKTRNCTKCGEIKPLEQFDKNKQGKCGRASKCKPCLRALNKEYYHNNIDKFKAKYTPRDKPVGRPRIHPEKEVIHAIKCPNCECKLEVDLKKIQK